MKTRVIDMFLHWHFAQNLKRSLTINKYFLFFVGKEIESVINMVVLNGRTHLCFSLQFDFNTLGAIEVVDLL